MKIRNMRAMAIATAAVVGLAACGSSSSPSATTSAAADGGGDKTYTIALVTHETPGDTYWNIVRAGAEVAAEKLGVDLKYSSDPDFTKQAVLVQNAVDSKVDGIALTAAGPDALIGSIANARSAGIPVVGLDSGIDDWQRIGMNMYFGSDEYVAGQALGKAIAAKGGTHALCVIHQEGSVALEARCKGVAEGLKSENIQVNGTDDASIKSSVTAKLQQDPTIDWVVAMGAPLALVLRDAVAGAGSSAKVATFDLNADAAKAIQDGSIAMAIDAQPYAQGFMAITALWLLLTNGDDLGGGRAVLTGPSMVDETNIDQILPFALKGTR